MSVNTSANHLNPGQGSPLDTFTDPMFPLIPGSDQYYALSHPAQIFCWSLPQQDENTPLTGGPPALPQTFPGENCPKINSTIPQLGTLILFPLEPLTNTIPSLCAEVSGTKQPTPRFKGEKQVSKYGKHDVLVYPIPDSSLAYVFSFKRKHDYYSMYCCDQCKRKGAYVAIQVDEDEFLADPCKLEHVCIPVNRAHDTVERMIAKRLRQIRSDQTSWITTPKEEMEEIRMQILENEDIGWNIFTTNFFHNFQH
ncbi:hypothetical protein Y032_1122g3636 [Ancylostoma ceylanicum]|uniref:Uncharacterized protein n=1 Tax=Ancylostoma ceylanicum TaxID=53326 RepID=A0A016W5T4_9BILA|nr:hypothetical protein Y032_1122g3636 [Ancylostoma ceylanicum]